MGELIHSWMPRGWCRKQELESLIGHLHHATKVVWPGRAFLHQFIDLLCCFCNKDHPVWINQEFRLDLQWWQQFLQSATKLLRQLPTEHTGNDTFIVCKENLSKRYVFSLPHPNQCCTAVDKARRKQQKHNIVPGVRGRGAICAPSLKSTLKDKSVSTILMPIVCMKKLCIKCNDDF